MQTVSGAAVVLPVTGSDDEIFAELGFQFEHEFRVDGQPLCTAQLPAGWTIRTSFNHRQPTYDIFDQFGQRRAVTRYRTSDGLLCLIAVPFYYLFESRMAIPRQLDEPIPMVTAMVRCNGQFEKGHPKVVKAYGPVHDRPSERQLLLLIVTEWLKNRYPDHGNVRLRWRLE